MFFKILTTTALGLTLPWSAVAAASIPVATLTVDCTATGVVATTSAPTFTPALLHPYPTRVNDVPASIGFGAIVAVKALSKGCAVLASKYDIDLSGANLPVQASATQELGDANAPIFSLKTAQDVAAAAVGQPITITLTQSFPYSVGEALPLFPLVHAESLTLATPLTLKAPAGLIALTLAKTYDVDVKAVYGITPVAELSDDAKLIAAQSLQAVLVQGIADGGFGLGYIFENLLLQQLKPAAANALPAYKDVLVGLLDQIAAVPFTASFFSFPVGGAGGTAIGETLAQLSNVPGVMAPGEAVALLVAYPELALLWTDPDSCFDAGPDGLAHALETALAQPTLTAIQKSGFTDVTDYIAVGYLNITACHPEAKEPALMALSAQLALHLAATH